jgi:hypothetical protein
MIHVKKAELLPSLLSNDEECIHEVENLRNVEDVKHESDWRVALIERVAGQNSVPCLIRSNSGLDAHVRAKHYLNNVVNEFEGIKTRNRRKEIHNGLNVAN